MSKEWLFFDFIKRLRQDTKMMLIIEKILNLRIIIIKKF